MIAYKKHIHAYIAGLVQCTQLRELEAVTFSYIWTCNKKCERQLHIVCEGQRTKTMGLKSQKLHVAVEVDASTLTIKADHFFTLLSNNGFILFMPICLRGCSACSRCPVYRESVSKCVCLGTV